MLVHGRRLDMAIPGAPEIIVARDEMTACFAGHHLDGKLNHDTARVTPLAAAGRLPLENVVNMQPYNSRCYSQVGVCLGMPNLPYRTVQCLSQNRVMVMGW